MSEKRTLRYPLDARPLFNDLFERVRDRSADVYAQVTECVARALLGTIKGVVARVQGHVDAVVIELTPPDGMRGLGLSLLESLQAVASRDPELSRTPLGRSARVRFARSGPAPEPEPAPPPEPAAAPPVVATTPGGVTRAFDLKTQLDAIAWWSSIKQQLAQYRAVHPELKEPDITIPAPRGMDADVLLECIAREAAADPAPLGFSKVTLQASPAVAGAPALRG